MNKKEEFREFVKNKPELIDYVKNGQMSWQKFYEIYDLYGSDRSVWDKYKTTNKENNFSKITDIVKNVDVDSIQSHINTAQKALTFIQELTTKGEGTNLINKIPAHPKNIGKFFGD